MVDPNRKINRLTDKDIEFLDECDEEFANRFTEDDEEFMEHCKNSSIQPPVISNWSGGGGGGRGRGAYNNRNSGSDSGQRHGAWFQRGNRGGRNNYRPYDRNNRGRYDRNTDRNNDGSGRPYDRSSDRSYVERGGGGSRGGRDESQRPPMTIRKDYGNFVPASKD